MVSPTSSTPAKGPGRSPTSEVKKQNAAAALSGLFAGDEAAAEPQASAFFNGPSRRKRHPRSKLNLTFISAARGGRDGQARGRMGRRVRPEEGQARRPRRRRRGARRGAVPPRPGRGEAGRHRDRQRGGRQGPRDTGGGRGGGEGGGGRGGRRGGRGLEHAEPVQCELFCSRSGLYFLVCNPLRGAG